MAHLLKLNDRVSTLFTKTEQINRGRSTHNSSTGDISVSGDGENTPRSSQKEERHHKPGSDFARHSEHAGHYGERLRVTW